MNCPLEKAKPAQIEAMKNLFEQLQFQVHQFLKNITYNMKSFGIFYNALEFQKVVTRIITPIQLFSQYHLFKEEKTNEKSKLSANQQFRS